MGFTNPSVLVEKSCLCCRLYWIMRTSGPGLLRIYLEAKKCRKMSKNAENLTGILLIRAMNFHANRLGDSYFCIIYEVFEIYHLDEAYSHNSSWYVMIRASWWMFAGSNGLPEASAQQASPPWAYPSWIQIQNCYVSITLTYESPRDPPPPSTTRAKHSKVLPIGFRWTRDTDFFTWGI